MAIKPGSAGIMMLRMLKRLSRLFPEPLCEGEALPNCGLYLIPQCLHSDATKETARVRLVVPVVPEVATTFAPFAATSAMEVPPVPTIGVFISTAAAKTAWFAFTGSALITTIPSISPRRIISAIWRSLSTTEVFTSESLP
ncbi:Uncharacterised protein [Salmonella enterica subsp. enterica serovar Typhi]|nr:Uncharacterised protein [Salmonella enterica subsp. enterica serovar Typhi]CGW88120.1 Uncharacterised protein [Salmonella enterica subsp. enterica serovar Typhi]CHC77930.1 Uncharacterised protein [Salmonella enterica subsp. enterica serovar Typhi]